jgi:molybdopterin-guanine dinucleotide biosynthesis protein B
VKLIGFTGWSGSGKTVLLTAILPLLTGRGLSVSTVKHAHHGFDLDQPGKDSWRHRQAGAREVLIGSSRRWALMHELVGPEPELPELLALLSPVDLVLVEGFKTNPHPKIEVFRPSLAREPLWPGRADIVAVAADGAVDADSRPVLDLNDPASIATWLCKFLEMPAAVHQMG